ncbi:hypothetical protein N7491_007059 [Penicillium cf. griseofulvum]|uniref:Uncharacterized protein n=1 Tax=Penicillium cf. griseofulvum TaxID=2972120 RepID=A0A9W9IYE5_9EURO|nr:hypothetical protein N7472_009910 [Penicillium cf. griseofulvum]KAJ5430043.1 hypothetical protein N7491_007059 [Penicillium cf. griseofulvum]KAJ5436183.1 hypothetical protein N7445_007068 [Penicillium cf. griseofulvum]
MAPKYPEFEPQGNSLRLWMERADEPRCPISRTTLTLSDIDPEFWHVVSNPVSLTDDWALLSDTSDLTVDVPVSIQEPIYRFQSVIRIKGEFTFWIGRTGPGVIFMDNIRRSQDPMSFYMSEFAKAVYESHFPLESLKYVFVTTIIQKETLSFIRNCIYPREGLGFPPKEPQTWESPSPEFCGILGTPIGKVVAATVLCTYGQGVKRIPRIVTFHTGENRCEYNLRFDIEDV